jgi:hypothetical protein
VPISDLNMRRPVPLQRGQEIGGRPDVDPVPSQDWHLTAVPNSITGSAPSSRGAGGSGMFTVTSRPVVDQTGPRRRKGNVS